MVVSRKTICRKHLFHQNLDLSFTHPLVLSATNMIIPAYLSDLSELRAEEASDFQYHHSTQLLSMHVPAMLLSSNIPTLYFRPISLRLAKGILAITYGPVAIPYGPVDKKRSMSKEINTRPPQPLAFQKPMRSSFRMRESSTA